MEKIIKEHFPNVDDQIVGKILKHFEYADEEQMNNLSANELKDILVFVKTKVVLKSIKTEGKTKRLFLAHADKTTFSAIPNIIKAKYKFVQLLWFLALLGGITMLVINLRMNVIDYLEFSVNTLYTEGKDKPQFPDVTMCNIYQLNDKRGVEDLNWNTYSYLSTIRQKKIFNEKIFLEKVDMSLIDRYFEKEESYENETNTVNERKTDRLNNILDHFQNPDMFYANLPFYPDKMLQDKSFIPFCEIYSWDSQPYFRECKEFLHEIWDPEYNKCYKFQPDSIEDREKVRGFSVFLYINNFPESQASELFTGAGHTMATGIRLAVHAPNTMPNIRSGFSIGPGTETTISIVPINRTRLSTPYSSTDCTDKTYFGDNELESTKMSEKYTLEACYDVCYQEDIIRQCHCLSGDADFTKDQFDRVGGRICGNQSLYEIKAEYKRNRKMLAANMTADEYVLKLLGDHRVLKSINELICIEFQEPFDVSCYDKCLLPCQEFKYSSTISSAPWPHIYYHTAFYEEYIKDNKEIPRGKFDAYFNIWNKTENLDPDADPIYYIEMEKEATMNISKLDLIEKNFLRVTVTFETRKPFVLQDTEKYTWDSIIALFGGTISMWSGLSILAGFELIEFLYSMFWRFQKNWTERKKSKQPRAQMRAAEKFDQADTLL